MHCYSLVNLPQRLVNLQIRANFFVWDDSTTESSRHGVSLASLLPFYTVWFTLTLRWYLSSLPAAKASGPKRVDPLTFLSLFTFSLYNSVCVSITLTVYWDCWGGLSVRVPVIRGHTWIDIKTECSFVN